MSIKQFEEILYKNEKLNNDSMSKIRRSNKKFNEKMKAILAGI